MSAAPAEIAAALETPYAESLAQRPVSHEFVTLVPIAFARRHGLIGLAGTDGTLPVAMASADSWAQLGAIGKLLNTPVQPLLAPAATAGCQSESTATPDGDYISIASDPTRDTETARKRTAEGTKLLQAGKYDLAEAELKAALAADLFHGPAHNNLGLVYLHQEKYYLAAWELQHAINLMPNQAEPRNNIGLVYEAVGQLDTAADWYAKALAIEPEAIQPLRHLVRTRIRQDRRDDETHELLKKLVLRETHPRWKTWARDQLAQW